VTIMVLLGDLTSITVVVQPARTHPAVNRVPYPRGHSAGAVAGNSSGLLIHFLGSGQLFGASCVVERLPQGQPPRTGDASRRNEVAAQDFQGGAGANWATIGGPANPLSPRGLLEPCAVKVASTVLALTSEQVIADDADLRAGIGALAGLVADSLGLAELLAEVAAFAVRAIPGADGAGVTLMRVDQGDNMIQALAASAPFVAEIDENLGARPGQP
jgi:hypothetical protein